MPTIKIATKRNKSNKIDKYCVVQLDPQSPANGWFIYFSKGWNTVYSYSSCFKTKLLAFKHIRDYCVFPGETVQIEDRTYHYVKDNPLFPARLTHTSEFYYITKSLKPVNNDF